MHTSLYITLSLIWIIRLTLNIVKIRRSKRISLGSAEDPELEKAIRSHGNAVEFLPIALLGLATAELYGLHWFLIHALGIALMAGRVLHQQALTQDDFKKRVLGMQLTLYPILVIAVIHGILWLKKIF